MYTYLAVYLPLPGVLDTTVLMDQTVPIEGPSSSHARSNSEPHVETQTDPGLSNPLVWRGEVSVEFRNILSPPLEPLKNKPRRKSKTAEPRRITSDDHIAELEAQEEKKLELCRVKEQRKRDREEKKGKGEGRAKKSPYVGQVHDRSIAEENATDKPPKRKTARESLAFIQRVLDTTIHMPTEQSSDESCDEDDICNICWNEEPPNVHSNFMNTNTTQWITCELCDTWFHRLCTSMGDTDCVYFCEKCLHM
jgi:hypothetical protein